MLYIFLKKHHLQDIRQLYYNFGIKSAKQLNLLIRKIDNEEIYNELFNMI